MEMSIKGEQERIRVLLVEDDEDDYELTKELFTDIDPERYSIEWARSYEDALATEAPERFSICLLDYRLGPHDGLELMRELRTRGYTCPMIMLTGQGDREIDEMALRAGAADYLVKGQLTAAALERAVRYAIQQKQFENERINLIREQEARRQAEEANSAKDEFLAVLSHELRTPLNAILGWVRLLRTNQDNPELFNRAVDAIERGALTQTKFVEDLLDVSRIVNGSLRLSKSEIDINNIVTAALDTIRPASQNKSITLLHRADESIGPILGDQERTQQIVTNVLSNAVKFTPDGGQVTVTVEQDGDHCRLTVKDTGIGMGPDFLPHIFDRYRQAHNSTTDRKGGLGLGLAIARHLTEMQGGSISAHSDGEGKGSTFVIRLPLLKEPSEAQAA